MITWQDYEVADDKAQFAISAINHHRNTKAFKTATTAQLYARNLNPTIMQYQKVLYKLSGQAVPDNISANYKIQSGFFNRFITQEVQYLLGNGVSWNNDSTVLKLGKDFDTQAQKASKYALVDGVSFTFLNLDHVEVFRLTEFVPLYDEENGALRGGIRWWQIDNSKPLRFTIYTENGYTEYIRKDGEIYTLQEETKYKLRVKTSPADGIEIYGGENYPSFPIVPWRANEYEQSELVGRQEQIDCFDLIKSGYANTLDDSSQIYWILKNAQGMDDIDGAKFLHRIKTLHLAYGEDEAIPEAHTLDMPTAGRDALLARLEKDLIKDFMALDTDNIASGANTATQIRASYEPLNNKTDEFEYYVIQAISQLLKLAGVDDEPTFTRSTIINQLETVEVITQAGQYLSQEYITTKLLETLGDIDKVDEVLSQMNNAELDAYRGDEEEEESEQ